MNKFKKLLCMTIVLIMILSLTACKQSGTPDIPEGQQSGTGDINPGDSGNSTNEDNAMNNEDKSKYRVGSQVSDAYVDPATINTVPEEEIKAKGYEYDYDSLTYELVWSDEFDYEGRPDDTKWDYDTGASGWGNHELQYYTRGDNAEVHDGILTLTARKEQKEGAEYTSTRLVSRGKGDWLYGKFEIRAKLPCGLGTWPAIWMLSTDWKYGGWPDSGEIDIMEHVGYDQDVVHYSIHTLSYYHSIGTQKTATSKVKGASEDFHVYGLEWLPDKLIFTVDGEVTFTYDPLKYKSTPTWKEWPFDKRFHLLLNIAVGGDWGGQRGVAEDIWPQSMEVDYVRVYQSPEITALSK